MKTKLLYYYYVFGNYLLDVYYGLKTTIFFVNNYVCDYSFYYNYILYKLFGYLIKTKLKSKTFDLSSITINNKANIMRTIIYKNNNMFDMFKDIDNKYKTYNLFDINDIILSKKYPIIDIFYKNDKDEDISIHHLFEKYADKHKYFQHNTLENIIKIEKLKINNTVSYKIMKIIKKVLYTINIEDNKEKHVSELFISY